MADWTATRAETDVPTGSAHDGGVLRFLTAGSVDDGKSTLIGRLLYDTKAILADQLAHIERTSQRQGRALDLSLLTDGLSAEREQGITIDVAYRYFATSRRKFIIADAPGHEQYTRNMVTAASTADLAVLLVDAQRGITTQTRRHATLAHLLGIRHLVLAVNKMDAVDYSEEVFRRTAEDFLSFADSAGISGAWFVPLSALAGDMVVDRGEHLGWYTGPSLLEILENVEVGSVLAHSGLRFPVQCVRRPQEAVARGYMGRVESGSVSVGDLVRVLPSGLETRIRAIDTFDASHEHAPLHASVTLVLEDELDVSRGDMIVGAGEPPEIATEISATVCWLADAKLEPARKYVLRHTTREVAARVIGVDHLLDVSTHERLAPRALERNDIGLVRFALAQPIAVEAYAVNRVTGAFVLIDPVSNQTVAASILR